MLKFEGLPQHGTVKLVEAEGILDRRRVNSIAAAYNIGEVLGTVVAVNMDPFDVKDGFCIADEISEQAEGIIDPRLSKNFREGLRSAILMHNFVLSTPEDED